MKMLLRKTKVPWKMKVDALVFGEEPGRGFRGIGRGLPRRFKKEI